MRPIYLKVPSGPRTSSATPTGAPSAKISIYFGVDARPYAHVIMVPSAPLQSLSVFLSFLGFPLVILGSWIRVLITDAVRWAWFLRRQ